MPFASTTWATLPATTGSTGTYLQCCPSQEPKDRASTRQPGRANERAESRPHIQPEPGSRRFSHSGRTPIKQAHAALTARISFIFGAANPCNGVHRTQVNPPGSPGSLDKRFGHRHGPAHGAVRCGQRADQADRAQRYQEPKTEKSNDRDVKKKNKK